MTMTDCRHATPGNDPLLRQLQGGDRRSIGQSNQVVALVLASPERFGILFSGLSSDDPVVRMRSADAIEKITAIHPEYLVPYKAPLLHAATEMEQAEVRWHLAPMLARLPLSESEQGEVTAILLRYLNDQSSIVKTMAMQALFDLAVRCPTFRPMVQKHLEELVIIGTPAMQARGKKLLAQWSRTQLQPSQQKIIKNSEKE